MPLWMTFYTLESRPAKQLYSYTGKHPVKDEPPLVINLFTDHQHPRPVWKTRGKSEGENSDKTRAGNFIRRLCPGPGQWEGLEAASSLSWSYLLQYVARQVMCLDVFLNSSYYFFNSVRTNFIIIIAF